jgi:predicted pyridoxine 5'-phosphate oxidase superfamily flavin-nucleotide-binding protein
MAAYHEGQRALQDRFDSRRLADRLEQVSYHQTFSDSDRTLIEEARFFMLATVDGEGRPDVSYKGGVPGFVRCVSDRALEFPTYDGNGQFRSLGNILVNPNVSLLFIDFESPNRLRLQGRADFDDDLIVRVEVDQLWPNCPRYIHRMRFESLSPHAPRDGYEPPDAEWKQHFTDVLPCTPDP